MSEPSLETDGEVSVLHLGLPDGPDLEHRFHPDWLTAVHALLDEVQSRPGPRALVTTAAGKFYSTGADLQWGADNPTNVDEYLSDIQVLLARVLALPIPTVAAVQGHCFGAGAFFAIAHDHTVMRADRGYLCFPGITIGASYAPGVLALAATRLPARASHEALITGQRYGGTHAHHLGLIDEAAERTAVLPTAIDWARAHAHTRSAVLGDIKQQLHHQALRALHTPITGYNQ